MSFVAVAAMVGIGVGTASASTSATVGCTRTVIDYVPLGGGKAQVNWVESQNVCGAYNGHFQVVGVNQPERYPIVSFRVYVNRIGYNNEPYCGTGWRLNSPGNYTNMGTACRGSPPGNRRRRVN
ncbi:hypothetical protein ACFQV2_19045 [Actinokineospora soli]|uniref:Secreted protein n=1 Tax=Actinokineospora soli TaxID=1048753 RepID=A0ABW2TPK1_9PSEU